jgi:hypothetical protein
LRSRLGTPRELSAKRTGLSQRFRSRSVQSHRNFILPPVVKLRRPGRFMIGDMLKITSKCRPAPSVLRTADQFLIPLHICMAGIFSFLKFPESSFGFFLVPRCQVGWCHLINPRSWAKLSSDRRI